MQNLQASFRSFEPVATKPMYELTKRAFDLLLAFVGLIVLAPLMIVIALAIRIDSDGRTLFRQERIGKDGRPFVMNKFRTMDHDNDDSEHREFVTRHVKGESESRENDDGEEVFLLDDGRITRVGRFLRRTSLDELPNLLNVVGGSMSIVGPRPPIPYEVEHYDQIAMRRLSVTPGMTGYAQTRGRGSLTFERIVQYDLEYIDERSFWTDVKVIVGTIPAVFAKRGV